MFYSACPEQEPYLITWLTFNVYYPELVRIVCIQYKKILFCSRTKLGIWPANLHYCICLKNQVTVLSSEKMWSLSLASVRLLRSVQETSFPYTVQSHIYTLWMSQSQRHIKCFYTHTYMHMHDSQGKWLCCCLAWYRSRIEDKILNFKINVTFR